MTTSFTWYRPRPQLEFNSSAALLTVQSVAQALAIRRINGMMFNGHKVRTILNGARR